MRYLGRLDHENMVARLQMFLQKKGIDLHVDGMFDGQKSQMFYELWVIDEDKIQEAFQEFEIFKNSPMNSAYDVEVTGQEEVQEVLQEEVLPPKPKSTPISTSIIAICVMIFIINIFQSFNLFELGLVSDGFSFTPIQSKLLFDEPKALEKVFNTLEKYQLKKIDKAEAILEVRSEIKTFSNTKEWEGFFPILVNYFNPNLGADLVKTPGFNSIVEGQYWRVFTPAILHINFLHLLFNMLWVWVLSRPVEERIGAFKLIVLSFVIAAITNVAQYLMSGTYFMGYSGVIMGLAGFSYVREKVAPWEGYPMSSSIAAFLLIFVLGLTAVQVVTFVATVVTGHSYFLPIANTAHLLGALVGAILGRFSWFSQKV